MPAATALPIWKIHADILRTLQAGNRLVLVAPTGSGKTTQVPQMLLDAGIAGDKMIVVLQPRRVAARTVATRVAWERGGKLGAEVGYQIRFDDHTSVGTRICFVTEGILLRWLQDDRTLANIGAVIFDEFHERNLLSDVALALVKHLQQTQRPDLVMLVMSATLDAEPVAAYLDQCPILISEGQSYPVEVGYLSLPDQRPITAQAAEAVERIINEEAPGDILVFMPGRGEINGTLDALRGLRTRERVACIPLHGELEPQEQDRAFAPNALRKVIVATNVAETSITIDGIRHVVDSGVARVARYDAERGIGTLLLEPISRASADQRKGRAGRTAPGTCHRLWTAIGHKSREERNTPEIQRSDLAEVVLLLHSLGIREAATFDWLDKPDPQAVERAERLLTMLGALLDADLTAIGRQMLRLPMHPRYSRMLIEASQRGCVPDAALCAALVSGRDLLARLDRDDAQTKAAREMFEDSADSDFITLMRAYDFAKVERLQLRSLSQLRHQRPGRPAGGADLPADPASRPPAAPVRPRGQAHRRGKRRRSPDALPHGRLRRSARETTRTRQARVRPHRATCRPARARKRGAGRPVFRRREHARYAIGADPAQPRHRRAACVDCRDVSPASEHHRGAPL